MQSSSHSNDERDEFKLSFKPMQNNGSANFMTQSQSPSILMTGFHDNSNASANSNSLLQNTTPSNLSMFQPMNLNASATDSSPNINQSHGSHHLNASNLSMFQPMKAVAEANNTHSANMLNSSSLRHLPTDSEVIFYESVPIVVRSSAVESNTRNLTLRIEKMVQLPQNQQILSITLTYEVRFAMFLDFVVRPRSAFESSKSHISQYLQ